METNNDINRIEEVVTDSSKNEKTGDSNKDDDMSDSSKDESSNSQSSMANSWVLVEPELKKKAEETAEGTNKFYLSCSEEPVQELCEHELGSHHSGSDSDTDGISVISESEPFKTDEDEATPEENKDDENKDTPVENIASLPADNTEVQLVTPSNHNSYPSNQISYIVAFSIVLLLIPLHWYFTPSTTHEDTDTSNEILEALKKDPSKSQHWDNPNDFSSEHIMIEDPLLYCTKIHENTDYLYQERKIKKCLKKIDKAKQKLKKINYNLQNKISETDENTKKDDDIEEIELDYKAQYSKIDNKENKREIYKHKIKYRTPDNKKENKYEKHYKLEKNSSSEERADSYKFEYHSHGVTENETEIDYAGKENNNSQEKDKKQITGNDENETYKKQMEVENKLRAKEMYLKEKEEYLARRENELRQRELRTNVKSAEIKNNTKLDESRNDTSSGSSDESSGEKIDFSSTEKRDRSKNKHKKCKRQTRNIDESSDKQKDKKYKKYIEKHNENDDDIKEGDWYTDMFEGRSKLRKNIKKVGDFYYSSKEQIRKNRRERNSKDKDTSESKEDSKGGHWYTRLFQARSKMRRHNKNRYRIFDYLYNLYDSDFLRKSNVNSNRNRGNSVYL